MKATRHSPDATFFAMRTGATLESRLQAKSQPCKVRGGHLGASVSTKTRPLAYSHLDSIEMDDFIGPNGGRYRLL